MGRGTYSARRSNAEGRVGTNRGGAASARNTQREQTQDAARYGSLVRTYRDGTRVYERSQTATGANLNAEQQRWVRAMDNVVKADVRAALNAQGIDTTNVDIDLDTGRVTAWVQVSRTASPSGLAKAYFDIEYDFNARTSVRPNNTTREDLTYNRLRLISRGASAY